MTTYTTGTSKHEQALAAVVQHPGITSLELLQYAPGLAPQVKAAGVLHELFEQGKIERRPGKDLWEWWPKDGVPAPSIPDLDEDDDQKPVKAPVHEVPKRRFLNVPKRPAPKRDLLLATIRAHPGRTGKQLGELEPKLGPRSSYQSVLLDLKGAQLISTKQSPDDARALLYFPVGIEPATVPPAPRMVLPAAALAKTEVAPRAQLAHKVETGRDVRQEPRAEPGEGPAPAASGTEPSQKTVAPEEAAAVLADFAAKAETWVDPTPEIHAMLDKTENPPAPAPKVREVEGFAIVDQPLDSPKPKGLTGQLVKALDALQVGQHLRIEKKHGETHNARENLLHRAKARLPTKKFVSNRREADVLRVERTE